MPSKRKRIGYLPSINAQIAITKIANKENLSQSKVVGILVEEALKARSGLNLQNSIEQIRENLFGKGNNLNNSSFNYGDLDELISDKGITYNPKKYKYNSQINSTQPREDLYEDFFEQIKQFIHFQKMTKDK